MGAVVELTFSNDLWPARKCFWSHLSVNLMDLVLESLIACCFVSNNMYECIHMFPFQLLR
jgi:hypothetical protein